VEKTSPAGHGKYTKAKKGPRGDALTANDRGIQKAKVNPVTRCKKRGREAVKPCNGVSEKKNKQDSKRGKRDKQKG